jgi:MerR family transcriptional regulator, copper efflux regulator
VTKSAMAQDKPRLLRVGELARAVGKTVRAVHLYEELGLLTPVQRTQGGFRLYTDDAVDRINWIQKLQAIGFSLSEIQGFVRQFESADSGRSAATRVREVFQAKLAEIRQQVNQLRVVENDLVEALDYLESCQTCAPIYSPGECKTCDHEGHAAGAAPELFAGLSHAQRAELEGRHGGHPGPDGRIDVPLIVLRPRREPDEV